MTETEEEIKKAENGIDIIVTKYQKKIFAKDDSERRINFLLDKLIERKTITKKDRFALKKRAGKRMLIEFFTGIKENNEKEIKFCNVLISVFKKKGEFVYCVNYGNPDKGKARILNYDSDPDILFGRRNKEMKMDIKELQEQIFKLGDLKVYISKESGIIVKSQGCFWIYAPESVKKIYRRIKENYNKYVFRHSKWGNKEVVKIGNKEGNVPLDKLIEKKLVERIEIQEWVIS